jgi:alkaline phosphatase D
MDRRTFLGGAALGAGALALGRSPFDVFAQSGSGPIARGGAFNQGVASGQPSLNGITLWSKVDELQRPGRLQVEISPDEDFRRIVYRQDVVAEADRGFALHHRADHRALQPGQPYFFRFYTCDASSPVGRFRTALPADSREPVRVGFFSCQDFQAGYYTAHAGLAAEPDLDLVVCLGDYIYERNFYTGPRVDQTGPNRDGDVQSLPEYREKYALYHSDAALRDLRARVPMVVIWDDHEVEDNYARDVPGEETPNRRSEFLARRAAGYRAFFEHHPMMRVPAEPDRIYGSVRLGANAEVFLLDQRQYRDDQPCMDEFFVPCTESEAPGRTYLGPGQKAWLKDGLAASGAAWKVVGNQAMVMALDGPPRNEINKDQWDGYAAEREELLRHVGDRGIKDVTFVTGDIHSFHAGEVTPTGRQGAPSDPPAVATEFVGGSMTSKFIFPDQVADPAGLATEPSILANNPHIKFTNVRRKGYGVLEAKPDELLVTFRVVATVEQPQSAVEDLARFRVARGSTAVEQL